MHVAKGNFFTTIPGIDEALEFMNMGETVLKMTRVLHLSTLN
jgi:hypothetical protein